MKKRSFTRYYPIILLLFIIEFGIIWGTRSNVEANSAPLYADECPTMPDDGKGLSSCQAKLAGHESHDHDHTLDYEPTQALLAQALEPCVGGLAAGTYPCNNIDLLAFLPLANIGGGQGNDIWGWTDPVTGNEYALMGRTNGTAFVDITDPVNPIYLGNLPTHTTNSTWRDIKVYQNHAFIVADSAGSHGMQIFDLTQLRTVTSPPVTFANTAHYNGIGSAHNIVINEDSGFAYAVGGNCSGGLHMINIQNPTTPVFAGCYSGDGYTHDAQCVNYNGPDVQHQGDEICFNSNEDTLTIVDVSNKGAPVLLSRTPYNGAEYSHQGWLTEDHVHFLLNDELDETRNGHNTRTYVWDVSDLENPSHTGTFTGTLPNIDHNLYVKGNYVYEANYRAGLRILDISNITIGSLTEVAYFDVYPASNSANFNGAWSNYPFFDSGVVIVSGIEQGLFVLQPNLGPPLPTPTPSPTPDPNATMHIGDLDGSSTVNGGRWNANVTITVHDLNDNPLANATVDGSWSNGSSGSASCVTNGSGQCTVSKNNLKNNASSVTFTVTNVTHASNNYQSGDNHDPDGDSDGTVTVVNKEASPDPTATPGAGMVMHVGDLDGSSTASNGNRWNAIVTIDVHDGSENPVANATVSGSWSNGTTGSGSCVTNGAGQCSITKNNIRNSASVTFTVTNVTRTGDTYNSGANHDPDGDSNGTNITILEP